MLLPALPRGCQQAREAVSLRLDCELSELGTTRLASHLRQCEACSAYAAEVEAIADGLRSAPFEHPTPQVVVRGVAPRRRIAPLVAGAAAVVAGLAASVGGLLHAPASSPPPESTLSAPALALSDAAILRRLGSLGVAAQDRTNRGGPTPV